MNRVILMGRLTKDPTLTYSKNDNTMAICRYTLAVDRKYKNKEGKTEADFINCIAFGKGAEFAEKYFHKGQRVMVEGHIQTGSYTNKDGQKIYTTNIVLESQEFADSKKETTNKEDDASNSVMEGFMNIPEGIEDELPFN